MELATYHKDAQGGRWRSKAKFAQFTKWLQNRYANAKVHVNMDITTNGIVWVRMTEGDLRHQTNTNTKKQKKTAAITLSQLWKRSVWKMWTIGEVELPTDYALAVVVAARNNVACVSYVVSLRRYKSVSALWLLRDPICIEHSIGKYLKNSQRTWQMISRTKNEANVPHTGRQAGKHWLPAHFYKSREYFAAALECRMQKKTTSSNKWSEVQ